MKLSGHLLRFALFVGTSAMAGDLTLEFRHLWKGKPLALNEWVMRDGGEQIAMTRMAYLVSRPEIGGEQGAGLGRKDWFGFINAEVKENRAVLSGLPPQKFVALAFSVGLDAATNKADPNQYAPTHPLSPVRNNLHWSWQGSYIFFAIEGRWRDGAGGESAFSYHLGNDAMLMQVKLPADLDLSRNATLVVDLHLDRVLGDPKAVPFNEQVSTHGREGDDLAVVLRRRIEQAFAVREVKYENSRAAVRENAVMPLVGTPYRFTMPKGFPMPNLPLDFPLTNERVNLGRRLFSEKALSLDSTVSCASCHADAAFSDVRKFSIGIGGQATARHAMPLVNLAWKAKFFWDGRAPSLRKQALMPIQDSAEMHETLAGVEAKLARLAVYPPLFAAAFGDVQITSERIGVAVEQFLITLTSFDSRFDRAMKGGGPLTDEERRGFELFFTEYEPRLGQFGADCFHCHGGAFFTDHGFHNNGLKPSADIGLGKTSGAAADHGKFSTPSLRNVAATAPYMHDGRLATLEEVVEHYTSNIHRSPTLDPNLAKHAGRGIPLSAADKRALIAFLKTLTDARFEK